MKEYEFSCHRISEGKATGKVLISSDDINFYMVDPEEGEVVEKKHSLEGEKVASKILVFPGGKGSSVVQADGLYQLSMKGNKPKAMIIKNPDTVLVTSAIIMEIPLVDKVDDKFYDYIAKGDTVTVDADQEKIIIYKNIE